MSNYFIFPKRSSDDEYFKCVQYVNCLPEVQHSFHTHVFRLWSPCFSTSLAVPCPPLFFFFPLSSSFLLSHSPLAAEFTSERSLCADWTEGELYKTYQNMGRVYLALARSVQSGRKISVTLTYFLWKKHVNQWIGVAAKSWHVYLWLLFFDEWCNIYVCASTGCSFGRNWLEMHSKFWNFTHRAAKINLINQIE